MYTTASIIIVCLAASFSRGEDSTVKELDPPSLAQLKPLSKVSNDTWLILFYAPWCPFSKKFAPIFDEAAKTLPGIHPQLHLVKIDASTHIKNLMGYRISSYPTVMYLTNGQEHEYEGEQTVQDINDFIKKFHL
ncbi:unnamed protein product [Mesocestoides corti]|uniref:Protein disulfide-isomerase n=1 Tax=Mesocestoides corti TaxID=53468 RepID=A0A0R3UPT7_MESCO|nr:unnamed protein product [Mesocestoides corti]